MIFEKNGENAGCLLSRDMYERLKTLARRQGRTPEACLQEAVADYLEMWEDMESEPAFAPLPVSFFSP